MVVANGMIFGEDGRFRQGDLNICGEKITEIRYDAAQRQGQDAPIDAEGAYVIPGLVDIHLHGAAGYDFCDGTEEAFRSMVECEVNSGVTSIVPATMTYPQQTLLRIMAALGRYAKADPAIKGITMEGPFISASKKGAQNESYIHAPDAGIFKSLQNASDGLIKQVTVAPELPGAMGFIEEVSRECVVSLAHSEASYEEAAAAFRAGADHVTHLYNAMPPFGHREPGIAGAAFDNKNVFVELICDGVHVHPAVVRASFQMFGAERICMISDSMRAAGMRDGVYTLGGQQVERKGARATLRDGTLAGAVSTLYDNLKNAVLEMKLPLENAVLACTKTPARSLKLDGECGVLAVGRRADLLVLDKALDIKYVIKDGRIIRKNA